MYGTKTAVEQERTIRVIQYYEARNSNELEVFSEGIYRNNSDISKLQIINGKIYYSQER